MSFNMNSETYINGNNTLNTNTKSLVSTLQKSRIADIHQSERMPVLTKRNVAIKNNERNVNGIKNMNLHILTNRTIESEKILASMNSREDINIPLSGPQNVSSRPTYVNGTRLDKVSVHDMQESEVTPAISCARREVNEYKKALISTAIIQFNLRSSTTQYNNPKFSCPGCREVFNFEDVLKRHIERRTAIFVYSCSECKNKLKFFNRCAFLSHANSHKTVSIKSDTLNIYMLPLVETGLHKNSLGNVYTTIPSVHSLPEIVKYKNLSSITKTIDINSKNDNSTAISSASIFPNGTNNINVPNIDQSTHPKNGNISNVNFNHEINEDCVTDLVNKNRFTRENYKKHVDNEISNIILVDKVLNAEDEIVSSQDEESEGENKTNERCINKEIEDKEMELCNDDDDVGRSECTECKLEVHNLKNHFLGDNRPKEDFFCHTCSYYNTNACSHAAHLRMHNNLSPHVCPDCGTRFVSQKHLYEHIVNVCCYNYKFIRYKCPICPATIRTSSNFKNHVHTEHTKVTYKCSRCAITSVQIEEIEKHIVKEHLKAATVLEGNLCAMCPNSFIIKNELGIHILDKHVNSVHNKWYVYVCKMCKNFATLKKEKFVKHYNEKNCLSVDGTSKKREDVVEDNVKKDLNRSAIYNTHDSICVVCKLRICDSQNKLSQVCNNCSHVSIDSEESENSSSLSDISPQKHEYQYSDYVKQKSMCKNGFDTIARKRQFVNDGPNLKSGGELVKKIPRRELFSPIEKFECSKCDFVTSCQELFTSHIIIHKEEGGYQCMKCGLCFSVKPSLSKHLIKDHKMKNIEVSEYFNKYQDMVENDNLQSLLKEELSEYQCSVCKLQCENQLTYDRHIRVHGMIFISYQRKSK